MKIRVLAMMAVAVVLVSQRSDAQQPRPLPDQLRLARVMPRGALVYGQASNLNALMRRWMASATRRQFYAGASYKAFSDSRVFLKIRSRLDDFENAIGFALNEPRLAELAGGATAVAVYDIGTLELAFVTEIGRERAIATTLFRQARQFQERPSPVGVYYMRDVTTDGGRLNQQFCFAHVGGRLILTSTEGLMLRSLANLEGDGSDSLLGDILATAEASPGFSAREMTVWLDQSRLNANRHFNNYWIHRNVGGSDPSSLARIETGLLDLAFTVRGIDERRWFHLREEEAGTPVDPARASALLRFAPRDSHLVEVLGEGNRDLVEAVSETFFGALPPAMERLTAPDFTRFTSTEYADGPVERYRRLDSRFDRDVDDDVVPGSEAPPDERKRTGGPLTPEFSEFMESLDRGVYMRVARSRVESSRPFVTFERGIVIEAAGQGLNRQAFERVVTAEMRARFVVGGIEAGLSWRDEQGVRFIAQALLEQGAAYAISGNHLVLASSSEFAREMLRALTAGAAAPPPDAGGYMATVRVGRARPVYDRLMSRLDGQDSEDAEDGPVKFFSQNLSSLIAASGVREMRLNRGGGGRLVTERLAYDW